MLPDQVTELLTAFVDGELSQRQRKAVMRLLHQSSEARAMLKQLQENAHRLKQLPFHKAEPSLVGEILQAIAEQKAQPKPPTPSRAARRRWLPYVAASLAASLLIGALGFVYWKSMEDATKDDPSFVKYDVPEKKKPEPQQPTPSTSPSPRKPNPLIDKMVQGTVEYAMKPIPDDTFRATFAEVKKDGVKAGQLARELNTDKPLELDIRVKNNAEAMERLKDVLRDYKITLVADRSAAKPLNDRKVQYLVFADNLKPGEVTELMDKLSRDYVKPGTTNQKSMATPYKSVTVAPIAKSDTQMLVKLNLLGEPKHTQPNPKAERKAVVLPVNPTGTPSPELVQIAMERSAPQAGTLQVLIRIHQD